MTWKEFFSSPTALFGWLAGIAAAGALIPNIPDWMRITCALVAAAGIVGVGHNAADAKDIKDSALKSDGGK